MTIRYEVFPGLEEKTSELEDETLKENNWCNLAEKLFVESGELGYGQTASVYDSTQGSRICLKRLDQKESRKFPYMNSLKEEAEYLEKVSSLATEEDGVLIPKPLMVINSIKKQEVVKKNLRGENVALVENIKEDVLVMEKIEGASLADIFNPKESRFKKDAPEGVDWVYFLDTLERFIKKMNNEGIFHRDLHMGNVMIETESLKPVVIDFGFSGKKRFEEQDVYLEDSYPQNTIRFTSDLAHISEMKKIILGY